MHSCRLSLPINPPTENCCNCWAPIPTHLHTGDNVIFSLLLSAHMTVCDVHANGIAK